MSTLELPRVFGTVVAGADYIMRPGGYAVIRGPTGAIAVVTTPCGCFLPGGGQEPGETPEQTAIREVHEECALHIRLGSLIGIADELVYAADEATHFRKRCSLYLAEAIGFDAHGGEVDHVLSWIKPEEAVRQLSHESQRWAVAEACDISGRGNETDVG